MSEEKKTPRWLVWLWTTAMEAATGATVVAGALFILAVGFIWVWGIVAGPPLIQWALITLVLLTGLVLIGRWFDRRERHGIPAPPFDHAPYMQSPSPQMDPLPVSTVNAIAEARRNRSSDACGSIRPLWGTPGAVLDCELNRHSIEDHEHQVSRPNGRYLWNHTDGDGGLPRWVPDDHWTGDDRLPPKEPFSWTEHNQAKYPYPRRTDETRP